MRGGGGLCRPDLSAIDRLRRGDTWSGFSSASPTDLLVAVVRINPFITTVGSGFVINGVALVMTENAAFLVDNPDFGTLGAGRWHGIPYSGMLLSLFLMIFGLILARSIYGEAIYAVGGNYEASRLSGMRVRLGRREHLCRARRLRRPCRQHRGLATVSAQANLDPGIIFDVLTIVVVGGTSLSGGVGAMWRTVVGLGIIATISNGFVLLDISPYYQSIIKGAIIVAALALDARTDPARSSQVKTIECRRAFRPAATDLPARRPNDHQESEVASNKTFTLEEDDHREDSRRLSRRRADRGRARPALPRPDSGLRPERTDAQRLCHGQRRGADRSGRASTPPCARPAS